MSYFKSNSRQIYDDLSGNNEPLFDFGFNKKTMFNPMSHPPIETYNEFVKWWPGGIASAPEAYEIYNNWDAHMENMSQDVTVIDGPIVDDPPDLDIGEPPTLVPDGGGDSKICLESMIIETYTMKRSRQNHDSIFGPGGQCTKWHVSFEQVEYVVNSRTVSNCADCWNNPAAVITGNDGETEYEFMDIKKTEVVLVGGKDIFDNDDSALFSQSMGDSIPIDVCRLANKSDYNPLVDRYPPDPDRNPVNPDNDLTFKFITMTPRRYCGPKFELFGIGEIAPGLRGWLLNRRFMTPNWQRTKKCSSSERTKFEKGFNALMDCICASMEKIKLLEGGEAFNQLMGDIGKKYTDGPIDTDGVYLIDGDLLANGPWSGGAGTQYTNANYSVQATKIADCIFMMFENAAQITERADMALVDENSFPKWPRDLSDKQASKLIRRLEEADTRLAINGKKGLADLGIEKAKAILAKHFADLLEEMADDDDAEDRCPCLNDVYY